MNRTLLLIVVGALLHGTALADHPAIGFAVYRTADVKQAMTAQGGGLSSTNLLGKVVFSGYAHEGSSVWIRTEAFQVRVQLGGSQFMTLEPGEYAYDLMWLDQKEGKDIFSLRGKIKPTKEGTLPADWDKMDFTVVFTVENLKQ